MVPVGMMRSFGVTVMLLSLFLEKAPVLSGDSRNKALAAPQPYRACQMHCCRNSVLKSTLGRGNEKS
jgi:hypothetical protein